MNTLNLLFKLVSKERHWQDLGTSERLDILIKGVVCSEARVAGFWERSKCNSAVSTCTMPLRGLQSDSRLLVSILLALGSGRENKELGNAARLIARLAAAFTALSWLPSELVHPEV